MLRAGDTMTGRLTFAAGNNNLAPIRFQAGTNLTTPLAGAVEWDGERLYITQTAGPTRKTIAYVGDVPVVFVVYVETTTDNQVVAYFKVKEGFTLAGDMDGCAAIAETAATDETIYTLKKNGVDVGTITFAASGQVATLVTDNNDPVEYEVDDIFSLHGPSLADDTLANIGFTFKGTRTAA